MATIDKKANRQRGKGRRIQPYAWLGAGALTLGLGAAMASGTAVAHADDGSDAGTKTVSHSQSSNASHASRAAKSSSSSSAASGSAARKAQKNSAAATAQGADTTAPAATATKSTASSRKSAVSTAAATVDAQTAAPDTSAVAPSAADPIPDPNQGQFIPKTITPGAHVQLAFGNIKDAQTALNQNTWGQTNILGGLAAIAPNALLTAASFELSAWQTLNPIAQNLVSATAGIPIIHQIAQVSLYGTMLLPELSQLSLKSAALLMPVVGLFAPDAKTAASPLIADATSNGRVYAIVPLRIYNTTEPIIDAKINGSSSQPLIVDTGSSGLVIDEANAGDLSPANATLISSGNSGSYSGGFDYTYSVYKVKSVDFGNGVVATDATINVVTAGDAQYPTLADFLTNAGATGILGVGANAYGPQAAGTYIPTSTLPGELSDGMLIYQSLLPFGLGGVVVFGPNPLPPKATISGTPGATINVSINGGTQQPVVSLIDSGGVYGTIPTNILAGTPYDYVPAGTKISVYTPDGQTLLYSYTTGSDPYAPVFVPPAGELPDGNYLNTGYYAFNQGPVYIDYRNDGPAVGQGYNNGGYGWTVFDIG